MEDGVGVGDVENDQVLPGDRELFRNLILQFRFRDDDLEFLSPECVQRKGDSDCQCNHQSDCEQYDFSFQLRTPNVDVMGARAAMGSQG